MKLITVQDGQEKLAITFVEYANKTLSALTSYPLTIIKTEICVNDYLKKYSETINRIYNCYSDFKAGFKAALK